MDQVEGEGKEGWGLTENWETDSFYRLKVKYEAGISLSDNMLFLTPWIG